MGRRKFLVVAAAALALLLGSCTTGTDTTTTGEGPRTTTADDTTTTADDTTTTASEPTSGGTVTLASATGIPQLDPHKVVFIYETSVWRLLWDPLTQFTPDGGAEPQPALAESWEPSDDLMTWTFHLRDGVTFSNGDPLTAEDVAGSVERVANPETGFYLQSLFANIEDVRVVDDSTIEIILSEPSASLPVNLAKVMIVDVESLDQVNENPIGTGPYVVEQFVPDDQLVLLPNENHWGPPAPLDELTIIRAQDAASALTSLRAGDIQVLYEPPWQDVPGLEGDEDLRVITLDEQPPTVLHVMMDTTSAPFDNPVARRAVAHAVDRETILEALYAGKGLASPANVPIPSDSPWFNGGLGTYDYDLQRASELFEEAGIGQGDTLTYWTTAAITEFTLIGEILQSSLAEIGIDLQIEEVEIGTWVAEFAPAGKSWPGLLIPNFYTGFTSPEILEMWAGFCECNYDSQEYEGLLAEAQSTLDEEERRSLYDQAQEVFNQDVPVAVVQQFSIPVAAWSNVTGIFHEPGGNVQFHRMGLTE